MPSDCEGVGGSHLLYKTSPRKLKENMFEFIFSSHISPSFLKKILCISLHFLLLFDYFSHSNTGGLDLFLFFFLECIHSNTQTPTLRKQKNNMSANCSVFHHTAQSQGTGKQKNKSRRLPSFHFFASILLAFKSLLSVCFAVSPGVFLFCGEGVSLWHIQCKDET